METIQNYKFKSIDQMKKDFGLGDKTFLDYFPKVFSKKEWQIMLKQKENFDLFIQYLIRENIIDTTKTPMISQETKTDWRKFDLHTDLARVIVNRADQRFEIGDERVKHTSDKVDQDGSWQSLALDELERHYAHLNLLYTALESKHKMRDCREDFIKIFCKEK